jgi:hypothetical protein
MFHFNLLKHEFSVPPLRALPTYHGSTLVIPRILNMDINIYLLKSFYSFSPIKIETDLKLWNNENRVKRTLFWLIQKSKRSSQNPLATIKIS